MAWMRSVLVGCRIEARKGMIGKAEQGLALVRTALAKTSWTCFELVTVILRLA